MIVQGNGRVKCVPNAGSEREVVGILAFLGNLNTHRAIISFDLNGEHQTIDQLELRMAENEDRLEYLTMLSGKAQNLIGAGDFDLDLVPVGDSSTS
jgi:hypothetical protein